MITRLLFDMLLISITTSFVIIVLKMTSPLLSRNYTAKWKYWIWMILAIRLLFPFNFSLADSPVLWIQFPESPVTETSFQNVPAPALQEQPSAARQLTQQSAEPVQNNYSIGDILGLIWVSGVVIFALYHFIGYYTFRKHALRWSRPVESELWNVKVKEVFRELGVKQDVPVLISKKVPNPMLVGFRKPVLFLPEEDYTEEQLEFILKHELVHYKRRDIFYKLLLLSVQAIHWFNPFVWLMVREAGREIELYCDETVVGTRGLAYRKKYCEAILSLMERPNPRFMTLSTNFVGGEHSMKQRFMSIINMKKKRNGVALFCTVLALIGAVGLLAACTNVNGQKSALKPGTIYSNINGEKIVAYDAGNSYSVDGEGNVSVTYRNGEITTEAPLKLDTTGTVLGMGSAETGFYISEEKTAIVYGFADGESSRLHVLISDDMGKTWDDYEIQGGKGYDTKFIGFTSKNEGWIVSGGSAGVGLSMNYVYQTSDGGKTWQGLGNPNELYSEHVTGAGFSNQDIGFVGYRYYSDNGPVIYWTKDKGQSWERLSVSLPEKFNEFKKDPLSPIFNGKEGLFPISINDQNTGEKGTVYLTSNDGGLTWVYDESKDRLTN